MFIEVKMFTAYWHFI